MDKNVKNILVGIGSALVIIPSGTVSQIRLPQQSDAENLADDWSRVGQDLYFAMRRIDEEQKEQTTQ